jgi:hypothetical protein
MRKEWQGSVRGPWSVVRSRKNPSALSTTDHGLTGNSYKGRHTHSYNGPGFDAGCERVNETAQKNRKSQTIGELRPNRGMWRTIPARGVLLLLSSNQHENQRERGLSARPPPNGPNGSPTDDSPGSPASPILSPFPIPVRQPSLGHLLPRRWPSFFVGSGNRLLPGQVEVGSIGALGWNVEPECRLLVVASRQPNHRLRVRIRVEVGGYCCTSSMWLVYRCRWQIELLFKRAKGLSGWSFSHGRNGNRVLTESRACSCQSLTFVLWA